MDPKPADLLLTGGAVHTVSSGTAEAVAVRGGRIAAVGSASDLASMAGTATRVVELEGRTVLPGFQDAHLHPPHGGLLAIECNLHESETAAGVPRRDRPLRGRASGAGMDRGQRLVDGLFSGWNP